MPDNPLHNDPLNQKAKALLLKMKETPWPDMLPVVQLVLAALGDELPDPIRARMFNLSPKKVMQRINGALLPKDLDDVTPVQGAELVAEAMDLDLDALLYR